MTKETTNKFEKLYRDESETIFRFCLIRVSNKDQAMDITQETFLRLWQNFISNNEIFNPKGFLFTVAHHLVIDWYRKKKSLSLEGILQTEKDGKHNLLNKVVVDNLEAEAEGRYLLDKISELTPTYRRSVYLRMVKDLSPQEIGVKLGISANTASVRVGRGSFELRKIAGC